MKRIIIIGGGVAGLGAAYKVARAGSEGHDVSTLPLPPDSLTYERIDDLQELVNVAAVNLIFAPSDFSAWQQKITGKLFTI